MIKAFLFDYGGVISAGGGVTDTHAAAALAKQLHVPLQRAIDLLRPVWSEYMLGTLPEADLWATISSAQGSDIPSSMWDIWNDAQTIQPLPEMMELVQELRSKGYKVGLLSNIIPNSEKSLRAQGWYDFFDCAILSCNIGYKKPDLEMYQAALAALDGIQSNEIVFLDDQERILLPARQLGMQTILVENAEQAIADVHKLLA